MENNGSETLALSAILSRNDALFASEIDNELVMMDEAQGLYFALNPVGRAVWENLQAPRPYAALLETLTATYEVAPERCRADVEPFLAKMIAHGLVRVQPA